MKNRKGQYTIIGIIVIFLSIVLLSSLMPVIQGQIDNVNDIANLSSEAKVLMALSPTFMVVGILISIVFFATPQTQVR